MSNQKNSYLESLSQLLDGTESLSQEKVFGFMDETVHFIQEIKSKLESNDPDVQKQAFKETMEMKRVLESQMQSLAARTGLSPAELAAFANNPNNLTENQQNKINTAITQIKKI